MEKINDINKYSTSSAGKQDGKIKKKKVNPRKRPVNAADVSKAHLRGIKQVLVDETGIVTEDTKIRKGQNNGQSKI